MAHTLIRVMQKARLLQTPDEILAQARAELEAKISKLQSPSSRLFRRLIRWRIKELAAEKRDLIKDDDSEFEIDASTAYWSSVLALMVIVGMYGRIGHLAILFVAAFAIGFGFSVVLGEMKARVRTHTIHYLRNWLIFPLMPFLRALDLWIGQKSPEYFEEHGGENALRNARNELQRLELTDIVPRTYLQGIEDIRINFLGEKSEIERTRAQLRKRLDTLLKQSESINMRIGAMGDDKNRQAPLQAALKIVLRRLETTTSALAKLDEFIAKLNAFLDTCDAMVQGMSTSLQDARLIREIAEDEGMDEHLSKLADTVARKTLDEINGRLVALHATLATISFPRTLPQSTENFDAFFTAVDQAALTVAKLEPQS